MIITFISALNSFLSDDNRSHVSKIDSNDDADKQILEDN